MKLRISEHIDGYLDEEVKLRDAGMVSTDTVLRLTMERLGASMPPARRSRKLGRTLLIAAALTLVLAASALAVYQYRLKDAVIEDTSPAASAEESAPARKTGTALSLNGFKDSPEYQAYVEWTEWNNAWQAENPDWFNELGVDDTYSETPENYANFYNAYSADQGEKLEEIMAKYGLTPHTDCIFFDSERQLCRALGTEEIMAGGEYEITGEYIYDDGSFKALAPLNSMRTRWVEIFVAVEGSFTDIGNSAPQGEEWSYTAADNTEVIMAAYDTIDRICVIAGLEGCYVAAYIDTADTAEAEAFADSIQWKTLSGLFATESARQAVAASIAQFQEALATDSSLLLDEGGALVAEILGDYYLTDLPETVTLQSTGYGLPDEYDECFSLHHYYQGKGIGIGLSFRNLKEGETALKEEDLALPSDMVCKKTSVNGYDALLVNPDEEAHLLWWLDTDRELMFTMDVGGLTLAETQELAGGIQAENPNLETGSAAYASRAAQRQEKIDALQYAQKAEQEAWEAEYNAFHSEQLQTAVEKLGDFSLTAEGWTLNNESGSWNETVPGESIDAYVSKSYTSPGSGDVWMTYQGVGAEALSAQKDRSRESVESIGGNSYLRDVTVNGEAGYIEALDNGSYLEYLLRWPDEENGLVFSIQVMSWSAPGSITEEQLIALAESVK